MKVTVFVHVVFLKVGEIDTVKETYTADVFVQARWREPLFDGQTNLVRRQSLNAKMYQERNRVRMRIRLSVIKPNAEILSPYVESRHKCASRLHCRLLGQNA